MGKGDKKTKRGKLFQGSYGITRPRNRKVSYVAPETEAKQHISMPSADVATKPKATPARKPVKAKKTEGE